MKLNLPNAKKILNALSITRDQEIDCDTCFDQLDKFVEMVKAGEDPADVMPLVKHHLEVCQCCTEETKALIAALQAIDSSNSE